MYKNKKIFNKIKNINKNKIKNKKILIKLKNKKAELKVFKQK